MPEKRSLLAAYPNYEGVQNLLRLLPDIEVKIWDDMQDQIGAHMGTQQQNTGWSNPDEWISQRLGVSEQQFASRLWQAKINPRWSEEPMYFAQRHKLIEKSSGRFTLTLAGQSFAAQEEKTVARIDEIEGLLEILHLVAEKTGKLGDFLPSWTTFCLTWTNNRSEISIYDMLRTRLSNLAQRGLIERTNQQYRITESGLQYVRLHLKNVTSINAQTVKPQNDLLTIKAQLEKQSRQQLRDYLSQMHPFAFEHLIKRLLDSMGYINVEVTAQSNDGGVDVVADAAFGINTLKTAIQVKRYKSNVDRPTLDQLRGSLYRFKAVQGAIMTLSGFTPGAKNAALEDNTRPIMLIDGNKLIDLLIDYEIGVKKEIIEYYEFDSSKLDDLNPSVNGEESD